MGRRHNCWEQFKRNWPLIKRCTLLHEFNCYDNQAKSNYFLLYKMVLSFRCLINRPSDKKTTWLPKLPELEIDTKFHPKLWLNYKATRLNYQPRLMHQHFSSWARLPKMLLSDLAYKKHFWNCNLQNILCFYNLRYFFNNLQNTTSFDTWNYFVLCLALICKNIFQSINA